MMFYQGIGFDYIEAKNYTKKYGGFTGVAAFRGMNIRVDIAKVRHFSKDLFFDEPTANPVYQIQNYSSYL